MGESFQGDLTSVQTSTQGPLFPLGTKYEDKNGNKYCYVKGNMSGVGVIGDFVVFDPVNGLGHQEVKQPVTASLRARPGVLMGAMPISGYGWIQIEGKAQARVEGTAAIIVGDVLKMKDQVDYAVYDVHAGTVATYLPFTILALEAYSTGAEAVKAVQLLA